MASPVNNLLGLFGFQINKKQDEIQLEKTPSFAVPQTDDGAITITVGSHYGTYLDFNTTVSNEIELITKYREMAMQPELEEAINQIVNEAVVTVDEEESVKLNLDDLKVSSAIKKKIETEFETILKFLDFQNQGQDWFRRWYVDGKLMFHVILEENSPKKGIQEIRYVDPRRLRKIREVEKTKDPRTNIEIVKNIKEYYLYNEYGQITSANPTVNMSARIAPDSIITSTSGLMDARRVMVLSYLNKAIKPLNQLRMMEDMSVIYAIVRAPERRVFYVDTKNLPTVKANQYVKDVATQYRNKLTYDAETGETRDDRKFMSMLEDIWLPTNAAGEGTKVENLAGGDQLEHLPAQLEYFQKKLYKSLGVPVSRLDPQDGFSTGFGRSTEVTRDEINFNKFIERLRNRFSNIFDEALRIQLVLKGVCSEDEWKEFKENIRYDYMKDNNFEELKKSEILMSRVQLLTMIDPFVGKYYSANYIKKEILQQSDEEIEKMQDEMDHDNVSNDLMGPGAMQDQQGNPMSPQGGQPGGVPGGAQPGGFRPPPMGM